MASEYKPGWGKPTSQSRKWHYFGADRRSLCGSYGWIVGELEQGNDSSPDNCATCKRKLSEQAQRTHDED